MNTNRKSYLNPRLLIALIVIILAIALTILIVRAPKSPGVGGSTPMPYTIDTGTAEPAGGSAAKTGADYSVAVSLSDGQAQTPTPSSEPRLPALEKPSRRISHFTYRRLRQRSLQPGRWKCCALPRRGKSRSHRLSALLSTSPWCRLARWATWLPGRSPRKSIRRYPVPGAGWGRRPSLLNTTRI